MKLGISMIFQILLMVKMISIFIGFFLFIRDGGAINCGILPSTFSPNFASTGSHTFMAPWAVSIGEYYCQGSELGLL